MCFGPWPFNLFFPVSFPFDWVGILWPQLPKVLKLVFGARRIPFTPVSLQRQVVCCCGRCSSQGRAYTVSWLVQIKSDVIATSDLWLFIHASNLLPSLPTPLPYKTWRCILYMWICMQMVIYTRLIQSIRVLSEYDYISVSWLLLHICHNFHFHFPEQCGDPSVYLSHHDRTLMACPLIWYYFIALYMFIWVVTGQGPHQGHWALCCLWVRVMFITSIHVNLYIRPCIFMCAFL